MDYRMGDENSSTAAIPQKKKGGILEIKKQRRNSENIDVTREYSLCAS